GTASSGSASTSASGARRRRPHEERQRPQAAALRHLHAQVHEREPRHGLQHAGRSARRRRDFREGPGPPGLVGAAHPLHLLLSFAQFERTRDKMAAARRRGKWVGGPPVLGYRVDRVLRKLEVIPEEAEQVKAIFEMYLR